MTPRPHARTRRAAAWHRCSPPPGCSALPGCDPRTLLYFLQPYDPTDPRPGPVAQGQEGRRPDPRRLGHAGRLPALDRDLTREFVTILRKNVKKIEVVDPDKVWDWVEAHPNWTDPAEAAKAFEADIVDLPRGRGVPDRRPAEPRPARRDLQDPHPGCEIAHPKNSKGKPNNDQPKESNKVYEEQADTTFPVRGPDPEDSGVSRSSFRNKFLKLVATEISWHFVEHAPGDDIQDVKFNPSDRTAVQRTGPWRPRPVPPLGVAESRSIRHRVGPLTARDGGPDDARPARRTARGRPRGEPVGLLPVLEVPRRGGDPGGRADLHRGEHRERLVWPDRLRRADGGVRGGPGRGGRIEAIAVACVDAPEGSGPELLMPCGACRQVLAEFAGPETPVIVDRVGRMTLADLLPHGLPAPLTGSSHDRPARIDRRSIGSSGLRSAVAGTL